MGAGIEERVVVITGASSGIGAAAAGEMASRGHAVVLAARRAEALRAVVDRCGERALAVPADLEVRQESARILEAALDHFGRVDAWINNVGRGITRPPSQLTDDDVGQMMRVNVLTALYAMQAVVPYFQSRGAGHVITISSMLGRIPSAVHRSAYGAAKHFLNALVVNYRMEVQATHPGVQFSLVSPGVVRTDFGDNAVHGGLSSWQIPGGQDVAEVARVVADLLESRRPDVYTRAGSRERVIRYFAEHGEDP